MFKKITVLAISVGALVAFAVPAAAQANIQLTEGGTALSTGAKITATSTNLKTQTANGTLECAKVTLHFEVDANGPNQVVLDPEGQAGTEGCVLNVGIAKLPTTITDGTVLQNLTLNTTGAGTTSATFVSDVPAAELTCHFEGGVSAQAGASGTSILNVGPSILTGEGEGCPEEGTISGTFNAETANGTAVTIDHS